MKLLFAPLIALALTARATNKFVASGPQHVPPQVTSTKALGYAEDPEFNPSLYRDSGGGEWHRLEMPTLVTTDDREGGLINGYNIIGFGDSYTTANGLLFAPRQFNYSLLTHKILTGKENGTLTSFVHNTFAYIGVVSSCFP